MNLFSFLSLTLSLFPPSQLYFTSTPQPKVHHSNHVRQTHHQNRPQESRHPVQRPRLLILHAEIPTFRLQVIYFQSHLQRRELLFRSAEHCPPLRQPICQSRGAEVLEIVGYASTAARGSCSSACGGDKGAHWE